MKSIGLAMILVSIALFFIMSAILMVLWNKCLRKAVSMESVKEIDYPTSMGLLVLFGMIFNGGTIIINNTQESMNN